MKIKGTYGLIAILFAITSIFLSSLVVYSDREQLKDRGSITGFVDSIKGNVHNYISEQKNTESTFKATPWYEVEENIRLLFQIITILFSILVILISMLAERKKENTFLHTNAIIICTISLILINLKLALLIIFPGVLLILYFRKQRVNEI